MTTMSSKTLDLIMRNINRPYPERVFLFVYGEGAFKIPLKQIAENSGKHYVELEKDASTLHFKDIPKDDKKSVVICSSMNPKLSEFPNEVRKRIMLFPVPV
jgi:rhodanese-related sulfurtransferase